MHSWRARRWVAPPSIKNGGTHPVPLSHAIAANEVQKISDVELASRTVSLKAWYYQNADWSVTAKRLAALSEATEPAL